MKLLSKENISDIAASLRIPESYVEKDWFLVYVLEIICSLNTETVKAIFAGGTSLSKGHKIIHRFSEDVDFSITGIENNRAARSKYRNDLIAAINATGILSVDDASIKSRDENRFTTFYVNYPKEFELGESLRNNLKLELNFKTTHLKPIKKEVKSFAGQYIPDSPVVIMDCISAVETAANKFSALMWRLDIKNRDDEFNHMTNEPALMRHLHDLSALYPLVKDEPDFTKLVTKIYELDKVRGDKTRDIALNDFIKKTIATLKADKLYKKEYEQYVSTMSYALESEISFDEALQIYEKMCKVFS